MATNPLIALEAGKSKIDLSKGIALLADAIDRKEDREALKENNTQKTELLRAQKDMEAFKLADARQQQRMNSIVKGAAEIKPFLEAGDIEGARSSLSRRQQHLMELGIDSSDTDEALAVLDSEPQRLLDASNRIIEFGQVAGILKRPEGQKEKFETLTDNNGNIIGQQSSTTGRVIGHPNAVKTESQMAQALQQANASKSETFIKNEIRNAGGKKEAEELAKLRAERFRGFQDSALAAEEQNAGLSQLQNIDLETGFGEDVKNQAARMFNAFGVNGDELLGTNVAGAQAYNAVSGKLVLDVMNNQKGPQTDKDQERIAKTLPNIGNEKLANQFNINSLKALNDRKIEMAAFYENYLEENETLRGADKAWSKFKRETPMLSDNVIDPNTGLPMFFNEFKAKARERNPSASDEQIIKSWRKLANGK